MLPFPLPEMGKIWHPNCKQEDRKEALKWEQGLYIIFKELSCEKTLPEQLILRFYLPKQASRVSKQVMWQPRWVEFSKAGPPPLSGHKASWENPQRKPRLPSPGADVLSCLSYLCYSRSSGVSPSRPTAEKAEMVL